MAQEESDEKKLERIRKMLDNPTSPLSNSSDDKYMAGLQRRLLGQQAEEQPFTPQYSSDKTDDLTPRVTVHHRTESVVQPTKSSLTIVTVKEKSHEEEPIFPDEDLFEIERPDDAAIPEFIEVKPLKEETKEPETVTVEKPVVEEEETFEELPQWHEVEEETTQIEPEKVPEPAIREKKEKKPKSKPLPLSKRSVVRQDSKEPEIWEGEEEKESLEKKPDPSAWEPVEEVTEKNKRSVKTKKKLVFARFDKRSVRKKQKIISKEKEEASSEEKKISPSVSEEKDGYRYGEYTLYKKELRIGGKEIRTVHFFSKEAPEDSTPCKLPEGYEVQVNEKTGVPYIRKMR